MEQRSFDVERVFREEHGRAVSVLVRAFGDIDLAEEGVQEAFLVAAERWPVDGLPVTRSSTASGGSPLGRTATPRRRSCMGQDKPTRSSRCTTIVSA